MSPSFGSLLALMAAMVTIQSGASLAKELFLVWGVAATTMVRTSFGFLFLGALWFPKRETLRQFWRPVLAYGFSLGLMNLTFYHALNRLPLGLTVALEFLGPLGLSLIQSKRAIDIFWALLAAAGVALLMIPDSQWAGLFSWAMGCQGIPSESCGGLSAAVGHDSPGGMLDPVGVLFALTAALAWALYIVFGKRLGQQVAGGQAASLGMLGAALFVLPFGAMQGGQVWQNSQLLPTGILLALLSSAIPYALEMYALRHIPTKTFGILMALEPVIASLIGFILLRESLTSTQILAVVLITVAGQGSLWSK